MDEELDPKEEARIRRRDRDAAAAEREPMRTGLGKQFKQVLDTQARRAAEAAPPAGSRQPGRKRRKA